MSKRIDTALTISCSFCGKNQSEVQKIIAGPNVFICDECAVACVAILLHEGIVKIEAIPQPPKPSGQEQIDKAVDDLIAGYSQGGSHV